MNYYPHHIGDFNSATRHLTRVERSLYRDLIELYYDTEQPLPADDFDRLARRVIAITEDETEALRYVLDEFFEIDGDVYRHARCDAEIEKYQAQIAAKSNAGKASARSRQAKKANETPAKNKQESNKNEQSLNTCSTGEQLTKNQEPRTNTITTPNPSLPEGEEPEPDKPKRKRLPRIQLKTFIEVCKRNGEKPISEYRPLLDYVEKTGLPMDYVQLAWEVFKDEHLEPGANHTRLKADWRRHFLNYIQKGYYRLWYARPDGSFDMTTVGYQAKTYAGQRSVA